MMRLDDCILDTGKWLAWRMANATWLFINVQLVIKTLKVLNLKAWLLLRRTRFARVSRTVISCECLNTAKRGFMHEMCALPRQPWMVILFGIWKKIILLGLSTLSQLCVWDSPSLPSRQIFPPSLTLSNAACSVWHGASEEPHRNKSSPVWWETKRLQSLDSSSAPE